MTDRSSRQNERGYVLLGVLVLLAISALVVSSTLDFAGTETHVVKSQRIRMRDFNTAEETMGMAATWMRAQSKNLVSVYSRSNFYTTFDRTAATVGSNDTTAFSVPTRIKMQGTNNSVILSSSSSIASSMFPNTTHADTGATYNAVSGFSTASVGNDKVRITLIDAVGVNPGSDYGDPDNGNAVPGTDFYPIYRVDSMKATDRGGHMLGYLVGSLVYDFGVGFYGRDLVDLRQTCDSYLSNNGNYTAATRRANCPVGSNNTIQIHGQERLFGSGRTNGSFNTTSPFGGPVCSDFTNGCPNRGLTCQGTNCSVPALPTYSAWNTYCPSNQGDLNINSDTTLTVAGNAANQKCWNSITIGNNTTLTLTSTSYSYFIDTLNIPNTGRINFAPSPSNGTINLYVRNFSGDNFNGNQVFNSNNKPYQLRIHYLGTDNLLLNGTAAINAFMVAPYAGVDVQGNFEYNGGIKATYLTFTGSGDIHYDESGNVTTLSDVQYKLRNVEQHYR